MTKHLVVHIGTGKTGSTAILNFCSSPSAKFQGLGFYYWGLNLEGSNSTDPFPWQSPAGTGKLQKLPPAEAAEQLQQVLLNAVQQLPQGATALWSNESIYERPNVYIPLLKSVAAQVDLEILVIAYARSHIGYVASAYKQWGIKHKTYRGQVLGFRDWITTRQDFLSYGKRLALWDSAFSDRFRIVNYNSTGDVVAHINQFLPATVAALHKTADLRVNASPPDYLLALYALYNNQFEETVSPQAFKSLYQRLPLLKSFKGTAFPSLAKLYPSPDDLPQIKQLMGEDASLVNAMLRRHGEPALPESFELPPGPDPEKLGTELLMQLMSVIVEQDARICHLEQQLRT